MNPSNADLWNIWTFSLILFGYIFLKKQKITLIVEGPLEALLFPTYPSCQFEEFLLDLLLKYIPDLLTAHTSPAMAMSQATVTSHGE